jgi:microcystin-dependent protein
MSDPFTGEIRVFGFPFPPRGWAFCDGQLLPIAQNTALFSILGTFYGGDGRTTFALPDFQGRAAKGSGQGPGLPDYPIGQMDGGEGVQLRLEEMASHTHDWKPSIEGANYQIPAPNRSYAASDTNAYTTEAPNVPMAQQTVGMTGQYLPHNNIQPSLVISYCIALEGVYPKRP